MGPDRPGHVDAVRDSDDNQSAWPDSADYRGRFLSELLHFTRDCRPKRTVAAEHCGRWVSWWLQFAHDCRPYRPVAGELSLGVAMD